MLVVFGANGRTGVEVVRQAVARGIPVRPVVRDDRDGRDLDKLVPLREIAYADAGAPTAIPPVLAGATTVVSCINPRNAGPGSPPYPPEAGANIVKAAHAAGVEKIVHLSVVGAYRWSPNRLNRESFKIDRNVRLQKDLPWVMIRVSCFIDEIVDGHVRPPDGGLPHPFVASARYSPISRRDVARLLLDQLPILRTSRTLYVGGPETFRGRDIEALARPWVARGGGPRTRFGQLPPGDVSVHRDTTFVSMGQLPTDRLQDFLDPAAPAPPPPAEPEEDALGEVARAMGADLRRVVRAQLRTDLARLGVRDAVARIELAAASARPGGLRAQAHGGTMVEFARVRALGPGGAVVHEGPVTFVRDELAEEFRCWWDGGDGLPEPVWRGLDMGVRRRLARDPRFAGDPRVREFGGG